MAFKAILELTLKKESLDAARDVVHKILADTRSFEGCEGVDVLIDASDDAHWLVIETWQSEQHDAAYRTWRAGPGAITELAPLLAAAPVLTKGTVDSAV
ncbi:putative quinol monooxygenase [Rhodococcus opacus]|uniref:putative quinol monooxygenase n=1 Tax=Rhodococcus opacus TaxID=37919 RepID=UPI001C483021|nr:antibiotic biosynthesis monooxygenase [Rhodococcus opacus]MBV6756154.1 antibiotic biosynthesis monooxygenase [Rhodococcus opacus]